MNKLLAILLLTISFNTLASKEDGLEKGFHFVDTYRAACKAIDGKPICHVVKADITKDQLQGYTIVKDVRISEGVVNGKTVLHAVRVNVKGGEAPVGEAVPLGTGAVTVVGDAIMGAAFIFPKAIPVILVLGAVEAGVMLLDGDAAKWIEGANNDVLNWTSQAMTDVVDTINPMKWEGGNVEYANTVVDDWIEGAALDTGDWVEGAAKDTGDWFEGAGKTIANWF